VVESLPSLEVLIPLVGQPRLNVQVKASKPKRVLNPYLGNPRKRIRKNEKEEEESYKEKEQLRLRKVKE